MRPLPAGFVPYVVSPRITLTEFEARIAQEANEIAGAFDFEGNLSLLPRRGGPSNVGFSPEEATILRDLVVTHSHPLGGLLSGEDAAFASDHDLAEIRAVLPNGIICFLARPRGGWPSSEVIAEAAERCVGQRIEVNRMRREVGIAKMSSKEAEVMMYEEQRNAFQEIGVELKRTNVWQ